MQVEEKVGRGRRRAVWVKDRGCMRWDGRDVVGGEGEREGGGLARICRSSTIGVRMVLSGGGVCGAEEEALRSHWSAHGAHVRGGGG